MNQQSSVLFTKGLSKKFGTEFFVARNIDFHLKKGARHALIGPNGAGKTTLVNLLTGVLQPTNGKVVLNEHDITALSIEQRVKAGLVRTFQINQLFESLSPLESLLMVATQAHGAGAQCWQPLGTDSVIIERCEALLEQLGLQEVMNQKTIELPYGKRRQLEIGIALACEPVVLLLDEPGAGVPVHEREEILRIISELPKDVSVLLIEHDMDMVFAFAERITVMVEGTVLMEDVPEKVAADDRVRAVYLGETTLEGLVGTSQASGRML